MIDWVSAVLPCDHDPSKLISGLVMSFDALGNQEWTVNKKLSVEGSYSSQIQIKSNDNSREIYISGNPTKFLQGHNLFGTNDLRGLMNKFFDELLNTKNIVGLPGSGFGTSGEGYFRLTGYGSYEETIEAIKRIKLDVI